MAPEPKRRKVDDQLARGTPSSLAQKQHKFPTPPSSSMANVVQSRGIDPKIQQAKNHAVAQAQQEGCTANFKIFDSPFGNFLVPVVPTRAELSR